MTLALVRVVGHIMGWAKGVCQSVAPSVESALGLTKMRGGAAEASLRRFMATPFRVALSTMTPSLLPPASTSVPPPLTRAAMDVDDGADDAGRSPRETELTAIVCAAWVTPSSRVRVCSPSNVKVPCERQAADAQPGCTDEYVPRRFKVSVASCACVLELAGTYVPSKTGAAPRAAASRDPQPGSPAPTPALIMPSTRHGPTGADRHHASGSPGLLPRGPSARW